MILDTNVLSAWAERSLAGQTPVTHRSQPINVRPGPLIPLNRILLNRRISRRHYRRHTPTLSRHRLPRRAKINQYRTAVIPYHNIPRLDVPVQKLRLMHYFQSVLGGLGQDRLVISAYCQVVGQVLLDGYCLVQVMVVAQVGDAETATAEDSHQFVFVDTVGRGGSQSCLKYPPGQVISWR